MKHTVEIIVLVVYLAMIFTLVRPGSQGPTLIKVVGDSVASVITAATGAGSWGTPSTSTGGSGTVFA